VWEREDQYSRVQMELERLSNQDHPFGNRVLLPPVMIIELLTITQAHTIWELGFGIEGKIFHFISSSSI